MVEGIRLGVSGPGTARHGSTPVVAAFRRDYAPPTETFVVGQVRALSGYAAVVLCRRQMAGSAAASGPALIGLHEYEASGRESWVDRAAYRYLRRPGPREDRWYAQALADTGARLVHAHFGIDGGYILPAARIADVPLVVSWYGYDVSQFPRVFGGLGKAWLGPVLREARLHLAMTPQMADALRELGAPAAAVRVHHFGIDSSFWSAPAPPAARSEPRRVLMVGSFVPKKGHMDLIRAFAEVSERDPEATLRLVGSGPLEGAARALVEKLALGSRVSFAGFVPYGEPLRAEYQAASVYVHPSRTAADGDQEGLPTVVLEAMAAGLPVVSTVHAGIPHAVRPDSGVLVGEGDVAGLAQALSLLLGDEAMRERMGDAGRSRIRADFDLTTQTRRLESLYDEACEGRSAKGPAL